MGGGHQCPEKTQHLLDNPPSLKDRQKSSGESEMALAGGVPTLPSPPHRSAKVNLGLRVQVEQLALQQIVCVQERAEEGESECVCVREREGERE